MEETIIFIDSQGLFRISNWTFTSESEKITVNKINQIKWR